VPQYRTTADQVLTVCKPDSAERIRRAFAGDPDTRRMRLRQLEQCRFEHIQAAVNEARNGVCAFIPAIANWAGNVGPAGGAPTSNVLTGLPACPGSSVFSPGVPTKTASQATCATWDPNDNPDPPGCDWFTRPEEPR
jgi:hypothetical protein